MKGRTRLFSLFFCLYHQSGSNTVVVPSIALISARATDSDIENGNTFSDNVIYQRYMQEGATIIWNDTIGNTDWGSLASIALHLFIRDIINVFSITPSKRCVFFPKICQNY